MIVVAIIGILAAIAIPAYQTYIAKSQVSAGLAEITPAKTNAEIKLTEGVSGIMTTSDLGIATSNRCTITTTLTAAGGNVVCTLIGNASISGKIIQWHRTGDNATTSGTWECQTNVDEKFRPSSCTAAVSTS